MNLPKLPLIVLTRPLAQSRRFAKALQTGADFSGQVIVSPLTRLAFLDLPKLPNDLACLIFTSETGVKAYARMDGRRDLPAWVVGPRTASAARAAGLSLRTGPGDAAGLAREIIASEGPGKLLYIRGKDVAFPLEETLISAGVSVEGQVAYEQRPVAPSAAAIEAMTGDRLVIMPLFSVQGARRATQAFGRCTAPLVVATMSEAVSVASADLPAARRLVATRPDERGMIEAIGILADDAHRP